MSTLRLKSLSRSRLRNLGVQLDEELTMKQQVNIVVVVCFFYLRHLCQLKRRLGRELMVQLVLSFINTRLNNYCNSIFVSLLKSTLDRYGTVTESSECCSLINVQPTWT